MKLACWGALFVVLLSLSVNGQTLTLVPGGSTSISEGQTVRLDVMLNGVLAPDRLRAYQARIEIVPRTGTVGSLGLVDPVTPDPNNTSIRVDETRLDFVFQGVSSSIFVAARVDDLQVAGTVFDPVAAPNVTSPKYCGEYTLTPGPGTLGTFDVNFLLIDPQNSGVVPTLLLRPDGSLMSFTDTGVTIDVVPQSIEPPNNNCVNSAPIFNGVTAFDTANATTDGVDLDASCDEGNGVAVDQDVWFNHVATCTGVLTVSTCDDADFDTRLALYGDGSSTCTCPTDNTNLLACSDDAVGCASGTSEISLPVSQGDCYTLRVGGVGAEEGTGDITITCAPDLCGDAMPITINSSVLGTTENTTVNDALGPDCGLGLVDSPGVWYTVTGTGNLMSASIRNTATFNTRLTVYGGGCGALTCLGDSNIAGSGGEQVSWCSTVGTVYRILVHGVGGATGSFTLDVSDQNCDDTNACTADSCSFGACVNTPSFNTGSECCDPATGVTTIIDDSNPCTTDTCNAITGQVNHAAVPDAPNAACNDANPCTVDQCVSGACFNDDVNTFTCTDATDCPGPDSTCEPSGFCKCELATLTLERVAGPSPVDGCYAVGQQFDVYVELGPAESAQVSTVPIVGAQFFLAYDPTTLNVADIRPGNVVDATSPFSTVISQTVNPLAGTIDYLVGTDLAGGGTQTPGTIAVVTFSVVDECSAFADFRISGTNGVPNRLVLSGGGELTPVLFDMGTINTFQTPPTMGSCPADISVSPDPGEFTRVVSYATPVALDGCDGGSVPVTCNPPSGSTFSAGTTTVTCSAADSCGLQDQCTFDVFVDAPLLTADVELSPSMSAGPLFRCITFDLWDCGATGPAQHATVKESMLFTNGLANVVDLPIPGGNWNCLTARDELHSLRSTAADFATADGTHYSATFLGSRASGGHWLLGGNLNNDDYIDILDFGVFFPSFLTLAPPNTPCGATGPHADISGDGIVDLLDLVFVSGNSLQVSELGCCLGGSTASTDGGPMSSISVNELRARGMGHLVPADVNHDGVLDSDDIVSLIRNGRPIGSDRPIREQLETTELGKERGKRPTRR